MNKILMCGVIVLLVLNTACQNDEELAEIQFTTEIEQSDVSKKKIPFSNVDRYVDLENASISVSNRILYDNGGEYPLRVYGADYELPTIEGRYYMGTRGLMCTINANSDGLYDRSEIEVKTGLPLNAERKCSFAMYVDGSFVAGNNGPISSNWLIFSQFWQYNPAMPPIAMEIVPGSTANLKYHLILRNDVTGSIAATAPNPYPVRFVGNLARKVWTKFDLHFKACPNGGSFFHLYQNDVLVYSTYGQIGYSTNLTDRQHLDWRCGIYRTGGVSWPLQHIWFDEMKYGN